MPCLIILSLLYFLMEHQALVWNITLSGRYMTRGSSKGVGGNVTKAFCLFVLTRTHWNTACAGGHSQGGQPTLEYRHLSTFNELITWECWGFGAGDINATVHERCLFAIAKFGNILSHQFRQWLISRVPAAHNSCFLLSFLDLKNLVFRSENQEAKPEWYWPAWLKTMEWDQVKAEALASWSYSGIVLGQ